ncbi:large ribosomal subunit protein uL2z-like [Vicia villosa]|uniref:large ribosomal subunit protein uL2z-like n=1 Tax=Vicia villosa TaxID=3911 RepID=UPI00273B4F07|nr:large ribosomal subunit protein uL2z-like [Vicia villosa]
MQGKNSKFGQIFMIKAITCGSILITLGVGILIKLPFGANKTVPSDCRAMIGQVARGERTKKPVLKAGNAYHKFKVKRNYWPKVRGAPHGQKVALIAAKRTGLRGQDAASAAKADK